MFLDGSPEGKINVRGFNCDFVWFFQKKKGFLLVFFLVYFSYVDGRFLKSRRFQVHAQRRE